jgi:hypothetical protein
LFLERQNPIAKCCSAHFGERADFRMINLHERLSEFSYGYGATQESEALLASVGLHATPFLPSLVHEKELAFDVGFKDRGRVLLLQFKLGQELSRFRRSDPWERIPQLERPFWRFWVDVDAHQFVRLMEFEDADADVYYVAPRFSHWADYERHFQDGEVLDNSLMLRPSEILRGIQSQRRKAGVHRIVYDRSRRYLCSEPVLLREELPAQIAEHIAARIRHQETSLESQIQRLYERPRPEGGPGRFPADRTEEVFGRATSDIDAMAAVVALEAWSQGAQMVFVTDRMQPGGPKLA